MKFFPRVLIYLSRRVLKTTLSIWPACLRLAGLVCWWKGTLKLHWKGNRSGGLKHIQLCPRSCKANANESWMLWEMCCKNSVKTYIERPKGSLDNAFYLKGIRTFRTHGRFLSRRFLPKVEMIRTQKCLRVFYCPFGSQQTQFHRENWLWWLYIKLELRDISLITPCEQQRSQDCLNKV